MHQQDLDDLALGQAVRAMLEARAYVAIENQDDNGWHCHTSRRDQQHSAGATLDEAVDLALRKCNVMPRAKTLTLDRKSAPVSIDVIRGKP